MSQPVSHHPEAEQLLRYTDGELSARAAKNIRLHLEACWQCRAELEDLENTVAAYVRHEKLILHHLPPPPSPWADIERRFDQMDRAGNGSVDSFLDRPLDRPTFLDRLARLAGWPARKVTRWMPAAAALAVVGAFIYHLQQAPSVQAAELLHKAVAAAKGRPSKPRLLRVRTGSHHLHRPARIQASLALSAADTAAMNSLAAMFQAAHYDWGEPLSAKAYQAWHDQLSEKRDQVTSEPGAWKIRTETNSGDLLEATLKLSTPDLLPLEERLEFRNREWVEISEVPEETAAAMPAASPAAPATGPKTSPRSLPPDAPALRASELPLPTLGDELHVLAALHQAGADLGDPIEISRTAGEVVVSGVGIAPERQQQIQNALAAQPRVVVRFSDSAPAKLQPGTPGSENAVSADLSQLQARIAEQIGGRAYFDQLAAQILDLSEQMMSRVYALRRLAERFPAGSEAEFSGQDRQLLRNLRQEHASALRQLTSAIDRLLQPVFTSLRSPSDQSKMALALSRPWQPATEQMFQAARRVERLLAVMFAAAPGEAAGNQIPSQLSSGFAELRAEVEEYAKITE